LSLFSFSVAGRQRQAHLTTEGDKRRRRRRKKRRKAI
jgi:hypothetical protein